MFREVIQTRSLGWMEESVDIIEKLIGNVLGERFENYMEQVAVNTRTMVG